MDNYFLTYYSYHYEYTLQYVNISKFELEQILICNINR